MNGDFPYLYVKLPHGKWIIFQSSSCQGPPDRPWPPAMAQGSGNGSLWLLSFWRVHTIHLEWRDVKGWFMNVYDWVSHMVRTSTTSCGGQALRMPHGFHPQSSVVSPAWCVTPLGTMICGPPNWSWPWPGLLLGFLGNLLGKNKNTSFT